MRAAVAVCAMVLALAGCREERELGSGGAPGSGPAGAGGLLTGSDPNTPFVATDCSARLLDDSPALAVLFSQPLDRKQKLEGKLLVSDLGPAGTQGDAKGKLLSGGYGWAQVVGVR